MDDFIYKILEGYNTYIDRWYNDSYTNKTIVTVNELEWQENDFADDNNNSIEHNYQIDIWGKNEEEVKKISKEVYKILKENDFIIENGATLNEVDTQIYRKALRVNYTEYIERKM